MNYIKKKIKGHHKKAHDEDENFDLEPISIPPYPGPGNAQDSYVPTTASIPFSPDRASERAAENKNSEEWQFFQQLTQRVQDTVQKTQSTLSKFKDSSALDEITKPDYEFSEDVASRTQLVTASWVNFEDGSGAASEEPEATFDSKKPARPPPPRPKPPSAANVTSEEPPINILDDFGFQSEPVSSLPNGNVQNLVPGVGFEDEEDLAVEEGDDPFDTSFVNNTVALTGKNPAATEDLLGSSGLDTFRVGTEQSSTFDDDLLQSVLGPSPSKDLVRTQPGHSELFEEDTSGEPDPFDTSFVDALTERNSPIETTASLPIAAATAAPTETDEMNNPFLTDDSGLVDLGPATSTPPARPPPPSENGYARPRKMSTNPFEMTDLLEDFILENSSAASNTQAVAPTNAFDLISDPVPSFGQDGSPFGQDVATAFSQGVSSFGKDTTSELSQGTSPFGQDSSASFGQDSSLFGQEFSSTAGKQASPFAQNLSTFNDDISPFGQDVFGQDNSAFGQDVSSGFGQDSSPFGQVTSTPGKDSSPFSQVSTHFGQDAATFGQDSSGFGQGSAPFEQDTAFGKDATHDGSISFIQESSAFGQEVGEVQKSSLPFELSPPAADLGPATSNNLFDPFASQSDLPSVPFTSDIIGQHADDSFLDAGEADDTFPPTDTPSVEPTIHPVVRNVINTLEKIASFATADDVGPPAPPTSSLFPGDTSKDDGGTGDSTPHALDFGTELGESKTEPASENAPINLFGGSDNLFGDEPAPASKQPETAQSFADAFLLGEDTMEPTKAQKSDDLFSTAFNTQDKSPFDSVHENGFVTSTKLDADPFGTTNESDPFSAGGDFFGAPESKEENAFGSSKSQTDVFGSVPEKLEAAPFVSTSDATEAAFFDSSKGDDLFGSSMKGNDPFGSSGLQADDPFASSKTKEEDPFSTTSIGDPFSVPKDVATMLGSGEATSDAFNFEPVKDSVPFTDTATFEAFAAKFEQAIEKLDESAPVPVSQGDIFDPFAGVSATGAASTATGDGFGAGMDIFDPFKMVSTPTPVDTLTPKSTSKLKAKKAAKLIQSDSQDSFDDDDDVDFSVVIRPKMREATEGGSTGSALEPPPLLPPPPKSPMRSTSPPQTANRFNPFNRDFGFATTQEPYAEDERALVSVASTEPPEKPPPSGPREPPPGLGEAGAFKRTDSQESPTTPLYDEDTSQPLEDFIFKFEGDGWDMMLRQPSKKKITGNRYWKKVYVRLSENSVLQLYNKQEDNEPFQELPLQACYSLSEVGAQQYDTYGKIFTVKLHYIFYRERVGVRPGQIHKVMQGQFTSVGQIAKLGLPLEHAPQVSQLLKIGTQTYNEIRTFIQVMEDTLFHLSVHRDRALTYKTEEIQVTVQDELIVDQRRDGHILKQKARVRLFFLAFMTGMPDVEVGLNDLVREGKEVVGRYDIIPVVTEEWIRIENAEFHCCVVQEEFTRTRIIKLLPPDACLFELMRFRIRPPKNRELPLQVKASMRVNDNRVELRGDILVPGYHSRKHGQVPCEDIQIRFPIPECWIYLFRVEKHFRYGSLKSAARKPGKIKGLERIMGTAQSLDPSLIEVSSGQAKYEHAFKAVVWRMPRLPKEGQGAYTTQLLLIKLDLTSFDQIPDSFEKYVHVEFTMPATTVSHTTVRSISVSNENPPEKYVKYVARHEYRVEIDMESGPAPPLDYEAVVAVANGSPAQPTKAPSVSGHSHQSYDDDSD